MPDLGNRESTRSIFEGLKIGNPFGSVIKSKFMSERYTQICYIDGSFYVSDGEISTFLTTDAKDIGIGPDFLSNTLSNIELNPENPSQHYIFQYRERNIQLAIENPSFQSRNGEFVTHHGTFQERDLRSKLRAFSKLQQAGFLIPRILGFSEIYDGNKKWEILISQVSNLPTIENIATQILTVRTSDQRNSIGLLNDDIAQAINLNFTGRANDYLSTMYIQYENYKNEVATQAPFVGGINDPKKVQVGFDLRKGKFFYLPLDPVIEYRVGSS